jgi:hypothetical protein
MSFVKMYVEAGHRVIEVARTEEQFLSYAAVLVIAAQDAISDDLRRFANAVNCIDLVTLAEGTARTGDDLKGLFNLPQFSKNTPLETVPNPISYDGRFPSPGNARERIFQASTFELKVEWFTPWPPGTPQPDWMTRGIHKPTLFQRYIEEGEFEHGWFTLNSSGWKFTEAASALERLAAETADPYLIGLSDSWGPLARMDSGSY